MRAMKVGNPATLDSLELVNLPEPGQPGPGEILVKLYASSLNYKDYLVAEGLLPVEPGRIPLCDGAGEVVAVGDGVDDFVIGDRSEEHTSELQSLMRISYAVFCLKKKK